VSHVGHWFLILIYLKVSTALNTLFWYYCSTIALLPTSLVYSFNNCLFYLFLNQFDAVWACGSAAFYVLTSCICYLYKTRDQSTWTELSIKNFRSTARSHSKTLGSVLLPAHQNNVFHSGEIAPARSNFKEGAIHPGTHCVAYVYRVCCVTQQMIFEV